jgi:hypothetical protein
MFSRITRSLALALTLAMVALVSAGSGQAASAQTIGNSFGTLETSKVTGEAKHGATFAGKYAVKRFVVRNHKLTAVGDLTGKITRKNGQTQRVSERVLVPVSMKATRAANLPIEPTTPTTAAKSTSGTKSTSQLSCEVLDLVLGPLDLNLLGLKVHLDRVHLNITAVPGAGALLGNLLCAVAGLLDGTGLANLNTILANLLNSILGILRG